MTHWENGGGGFQIVEPDLDTPDKIMARNEPLHPDDLEDCDHELAPCVGGEDIDFKTIKKVPSDALLILLRFLIPPNNGRNQRKRWRTAQLRLAVLAHAAGLEGVADHSLTELGEQLGVTRALMSLYAVRLVDDLQQERVRGGKQRVSRESYRQAAIASHRARGHSIKADAAAEDAL